MVVGLGIPRTGWSEVIGWGDGGWALLLAPIIVPRVKAMGSLRRVRRIGKVWVITGYKDHADAGGGLSADRFGNEETMMMTDKSKTKECPICGAETRWRIVDDDNKRVAWYCLICTSPFGWASLWYLPQTADVAA